MPCGRSKAASGLATINETEGLKQKYEGTETSNLERWPRLPVKTPEHRCQRLPIPKATSLACYNMWKLVVDLKLAKSGK